MTFVVQTMYISTGAKNAMHTLRMRRDCAGINPNFLPDFYMRNLAVDVELAQEKAKAYFDAWCERVGGSRDDFKMSLELEPEYDIKKRRGRLSAHETDCIETIEAGFFPFGKHKGVAIDQAPDTYVVFFADKAKDDQTENPVMAALSAACLGVALEMGWIAKRDAARVERDRLDQLSQFVGKIGERLEFTGEVVTKFWKSNAPEDATIRDKFGYWITKIRCSGNLIVYVGDELGERGATIRFKATVKKHDDYKGVKSTKINRPKILEPES